MTALQFNLFTGEPEDRRTRKQRQAERNTRPMLTD